MLNEIAATDTLRTGMCQQLAHDVELMTAREQLLAFYPTSLGVFLGDDLGVILDDVREAEGCQDLLPQIVGGEAGGIGRISRAIVPTLVKRQEPRAFALEMGAEPHLMVIHREMGDASAELEQFLARISVALVLLDRILDGLLGQAVFQLECRDRQAVDEQRQVERVGISLAVAQLPGHREPVLREPLGCLRVAG
jgi:hypothetical protein